VNGDAVPYISTPTCLPEVLVLQPKIFNDARGLFFESFNARDFELATGCPQGKLVRVVMGEVFDVAVDLRRGSPNFGKWAGTVISADNRLQLWIPEGFAHGFLVLSERADFLYKTTDYWYPQYERTLIWNDPVVGINWPLSSSPLLSAKDANGKRLAEAETF
jgi:dTDP-4-dehydrorhamnose 3,5-epimerase